MDPAGFVLLAALTAFGGGTVRDVLLGRPAAWLDQPGLVVAAAGIGLGVFFGAARLERRASALLWADAVGLAVFAVLGAEAARASGVSGWAAVLMGVFTATLGGVMRDVVCGTVPLILRREIYATAALLGAAAHAALDAAGAGREVSLGLGALLAFGLRAAALRRGWSLPTYGGGRETPPGGG